MRRRTAFTLVELLVVIAIIGILVALLLPAIQAAREAARRSQCANHLKQIATACMLHENTHKSYPSGGWVKFYSADPNMGFGADQPGSWYYNILPYIEEQQLRDLGKGTTPGSAAFDTAMMQLQQSPVATFHCPSRRTAKLYPALWGKAHDPFDWLESLKAIAKGDYAANSGDSMTHAGNGYSTDQFYPGTSSPISRYPSLAGAAWTDTTQGPTSRFFQTGVIHYRSEIGIKNITDGTSKTYLVGEKFLTPEMYEATDDPILDRSKGDNQGLWSGFEWDNHRVAYNPLGGTDPNWHQPRQDNANVTDKVNVYAFGSAHPGTMNMAFSDGSVQSIDYDIDVTVHELNANRLDGGSPPVRPPSGPRG